MIKLSDIKKGNLAGSVFKFYPQNEVSRHLRKKDARSATVDLAILENNLFIPEYFDGVLTSIYSLTNIERLAIWQAKHHTNTMCSALVDALTLEVIHKGNPHMKDLYYKRSWPRVIFWAIVGGLYLGGLISLVYFFGALAEGMKY